MRDGTWIGMEDALHLMKNLPDRVRRSTISAAASKVLLPTKRQAQNNFIKNEKKTGQGGYSKARMLSRSLKVVRLKDKKNPGARLVFKSGKMVVDNKGTRWDIYKYGLLHAWGSKKARFTRGTKAKRGSVGGFGDAIYEAGNSRRAIMDNQFGYELEKILVKEEKKLSR